MTRFWIFHFSLVGVSVLIGCACYFAGASLAVSYCAEVASLICLYVAALCALDRRQG